MNSRIIFGLFLSAFSGYLALSYELIWTRAFGISTSTRGYAFPMLLGLFLAGIAYGAKLSKRFSEKSTTYDSEGLRRVGWVIFTSSIVGFLVAPAMAWYLRVAYMMPHFTALYIVFFAAIIFGIQFPLISHFGIPANEQSGSRLSYFYLANIIGSVAGSLLTGLVFFNLTTLETQSFVLSIVGVVFATGILIKSNPQNKVKYAAILVLACAALTISKPFLFHKFWENLIYQNEASDHTFVTVMESSSGVLTVNEEDVSIGSGAYDGTFNVDLIDDTNGIIRAYATPAFNPSPKKVLMIGLATGSWARAIVNFEEVEKLTIIEIETDYLELLANRPEYKAFLENPKVEIISDDGRRWMNANDEKFDFIVSNTTFHFRAMAATILSKEFFKLINDHLAEKGVFYFNTTGADRAYRTIFESFKYGARFQAFGIGSNFPISMDVERFREKIATWEIEGKPVYDLSLPEHQKHLDKVSTYFTDHFESSDHLRERVKDLEPYTDDNLGDEFTGLTSF